MGLFILLNFHVYLLFFITISRKKALKTVGICSPRVDYEPPHDSYLFIGLDCYKQKRGRALPGSLSFSLLSSLYPNVILIFLELEHTGSYILDI